MGNPREGRGPGRAAGRPPRYPWGHMLEVETVSKSFGRFQAVRGVSLSVQPGQVVGLLGPNGAGKTTTMRMITGMFPPDAGRIRVGGADTVEESAKARRAIGYLPEAAPAYGEMSVRGYLDFRARLYGMPWRDRRTSISRVVERCWLGEVVARRVGVLSKGYRQRVGLAAAIVHDPRVLVLDEPSNGLDPTQILEMRRLIRELGRDRVVLVSSHILPEVEKTCDRVVVMIRGRVRADGSPAALTGDAERVVVEATRPGADETAMAALLRGACGEGARIHAAALDGVVRGTVVGAGPEARRAIGAALLAGGWSVRELTTDRRSLEAVFIGLLEAEGEGMTPGAPR